MFFTSAPYYQNSSTIGGASRPEAAKAEVGETCSIRNYGLQDALRSCAEISRGCPVRLVTDGPFRTWLRDQDAAVAVRLADIGNTLLIGASFSSDS